MQRRVYKAEGFVIKRKNYGEADRMVTLFTKTEGKIVVIAKGIRKISSRKSPHLEIFNKVEVYLSENKGLPIVTEVKALNSYQGLKSNISYLAYSYRILELVERLCPEKEGHLSIYFLLNKVLDELDIKNQAFAREVTDQFTVVFLRELGYLPPNRELKGEELEQFLRTILERNLSSNALLGKISV